MSFGNSEDEWQKAKILAFYPEHLDKHEKNKQSGLWEGVIEFMRAFTNENDDYHDHPIEIINTTLFTIVIKEVEKDMFLWLILSHANLFSDNNYDHVDDSISNFTPEPSLFREEDTSVFKDVLRLYYDLFCLFHHSLRILFEKDPSMLQQVLNEYSMQFDKHFFHNDWGRTYFNNCVYRGFSICPLDSKLHLYVQKYINSIKIENPGISHVVAFYKDLHLYSDIPHEAVELLYTYVIGCQNEKIEGYVASWIDYGAKGHAVRVLKKPNVGLNKTITESGEEDEK